MHLKKYSLFILLLLEFTFVIKAQTTPNSFSKKPADFIVEYNQFLSVDNTKEGTEILKIFTEKWNLGNFEETEQRTIIKVSNEMLMKSSMSDP